jgi:HPt (histidine-containing phosphotransfer) domain-containing protein
MTGAPFFCIVCLVSPNNLDLRVPHQSDSFAVLDEDALRQVREEAPGIALQELIEIFTSEITTRLQRIKDALAQSDLNRAEYEAHTLSGTSGTFGAMRLQALAGELERLSRAGDTASAGDVLTTLEPAMDEACAAFRDYAGNGTSS